MPYEEKYTRPAPPAAPQNAVIENRSRLSVSGVSSVSSYDDNRVVMETSKGVLLVSGSGLHMEKLSLESGEALITGVIDGLSYENEENDRGGFFARLFR